MKKLLLLSLPILLFSILFVQAIEQPTNISVNTSDKVDLYFFYLTGCPHCENMEKFLDQLIIEQPYLNVKKYEIRQNMNLFLQLADKYKLDTEKISVPVVFLHEKVYIGDTKDIEESIKNYANQCVQDICLSPTKLTTTNTTQTIGQGQKVEKKITITLLLSLFAAAIIDSISPCEISIIILLVTTVLLTGNKKKALYAGLAFSTSMFLSYLMMGIFIYSTIKIAGFSAIFYKVIATIAILVGIFNLKDYLWYGKWFVMEVPLSWRPGMKTLIRGVTSVPGAFLVGFVVSLFLTPCTSGPYLTAIGMLTEATTKNQGILLLVLYNLVFILPMVLITLLISLGFTTADQVENWRTKKLKVLHLITGIIMIALGIWMWTKVYLGIL